MGWRKGREGQGRGEEGGRRGEEGGGVGDEGEERTRGGEKVVLEVWKPDSGKAIRFLCEKKSSEKCSQTEGG